jgi:bifunctional non-homologous end joining protein LigD
MIGRSGIHGSSRFVLDGEAAVLGPDGISNFNALHSGKHNHEVQLYAFDLLAMDGDDLRELPLLQRKARLDKLLARRADSIFLGSFEQGEIGPDLFRHACMMGLEGLVSKRRDRPYRGGRSKDWIKMKNRTHPAMERVIEAFKRLEQSDPGGYGREKRRGRNTTGIGVSPAAS